MDVNQLARAYRIPLIDFGSDGMPAWGPRRGVLVSSGAGIMTSVMDMVPFRWCVDSDELRGKMQWLPSFFQAAHHIDRMMGICGWFSLDNPAPLRMAIDLCTPDTVPNYFGGMEDLQFGWGAIDLASFVSTCQARYHVTTPP